MFKLLLVLLVVATVSLHVVDDLTEEKIELALADRLNEEPSRRLLSNGEAKLSTSRASLSTQYPGYPASNCIDGNHNSMCHGLTNHGVSGGDTLTVYLSRTENVSRIRIINRKGCCRDRINGAEVKAGNTRCGYVPRTSAWQFDISCPNVRTDRITIRTIGRALNLEEVEVYGRSAGGSSARTQNTVIENAPGVGGWGGSCTCPDGNVYQVGDNNNYCSSLACEGGISGTCNRYFGSWSGRKVICAVSGFSKYHCHERACVYGNNIRKWSGYTREQCAQKCDQYGSRCKGFEYGVNYGGSGRYRAADCQLQSSANYGYCDGSHYNLDLCLKSREYALEKYTCHKKACVYGNNIIKWRGYTREQCAQKCDQYGSRCKGFEYGVNYGGSGRYRATDCQLQSSANYGHCDGTYYNLDLCVKN